MLSIVSVQWVLEADRTLMLSGVNVYLAVPARTASPWKTRHCRRWNSMSECGSVLLQSRFEVRIESPNDPLYDSIRCADLAGWEHVLPRTLWLCRGGESLGTCTPSHTHTHTHSWCRCPQGLPPTPSWNRWLLLLLFLSGRNWQCLPCSKISWTAWAKVL